MAQTGAQMEGIVGVEIISSWNELSFRIICYLGGKEQIQATETLSGYAFVGGLTEWSDNAHIHESLLEVIDVA